MTPMSESQRRACTALTDTLRRSGVDAPAHAPDGAEALPAWADAVESSWRKLYREARKKAEVSDAVVASVPRPGVGAASAEEAPWRRLEEACRRVEQEIRAPASLRGRLDEGRRSMMPRLEHATREKLVPIITEQDGKLRAELDPAGVAGLQAELPGWLKAWTEYAYRWYETDFDRLVEDAWNPRDGGVPVPAPSFADLATPTLAADIRFPVINLQKEQPSTIGGVFKHGRQGMMMLLGVVGLAGAGTSDLKTNPFFLGAVALGALYVGWSQASAEREKQRETLENEVRNRAEQATRDMLRVWLDRVADKLNEDARTQLQARRAAFVQWYREQVMPAQEKSRASAQKAAEEIERMRKELPKLHERVRELAKVEDAIKAARSAA
jgi:hypothetical protein